ncbi:MAG: Rne/Rng family ribonuclease [Alphaproteobacteria bacterium]
MLIDASHPEETRVVVLHGNRVEDFDFETASRKQLRGNIYLARVVRIEPSLQAAFVEYGGGRHGFLPFTEIHPDYYQLPVADRERLIAEEAAAARMEEAEPEPLPAETAPGTDAIAEPPASGETETALGPDEPSRSEPYAEDSPVQTWAEAADAAPAAATEEAGSSESSPPPQDSGAPTDVEMSGDLETVGGDVTEEPERTAHRSYRRYKIQEVVKRRQILLVQVVKEERGTKGAALTTYLSLAGRYCVLMPNAHRGGGISRKISNAADRKRLKSIIADLETPEGMAVIIRTAGMNRSRAELKRDHEYLLRLWESIRETTLNSNAPALVYEEANLIKRSIRDLYAREIEEILVEGEDGYRIAKDFMRMLMPSHAKRVQPYRDETVPLFQRFQVEGQLDAIHNETVTLRSGGYIVINPTEALVAIDVNSGRSTRERNIEETAYRTNLEAADEVARQLRLRDLAGLVVVDFIDMEDQRNVRNVERRLKDAMKTDRARIQIGRISPFGLLEMSRQRLRLSLLEISTERCPTCGGRGHVRSTDSSAFHVLRAIEEDGMRRRSAEIVVHLPTRVLLNLLNEKRQKLNAIEERYAFRVRIEADDSLLPPAYRIERIRARTPEEIAALPPVAETALPAPSEPEPEDETDVTEAESQVRESQSRESPARAEPRERSQPRERDERGERRERGGRRRRGRGGERREQGEGRDRQRSREIPVEAAAETAISQAAEGEPASAEEPSAVPTPAGDGTGEAHGTEESRRRRRRGRRGGRRRRRERPQQEDAQASASGEATAGHDTDEHDTGEHDTGEPELEPSLLPEAEPKIDYMPSEPVEPRGVDAPWPSDGEATAPAAAEQSGTAEPGHGERTAHWPEDKSAEPAAVPPSSQAEDEPKGERKRGWWQRVLS